jgi:hypothetical protein
MQSVCSQFSAEDKHGKFALVEEEEEEEEVDL